MSKIIRRLTKRGAVAVEFCDSCGEVCTAVCRAEARRDRQRAQALLVAPFMR
jgi:hypothetical protein